VLLLPWVGLRRLRIHGSQNEQQGGMEMRQSGPCLVDGMTFWIHRLRDGMACVRICRWLDCFVSGLAVDHG